MIAFVVNGVVYAQQGKKTAIPAEKANAHENIVARELGEREYVVRLYHGKIAVFEIENPDAPAKITEISAETLRVHDKEQLERGIKVYGEIGLAMLLEDFGS
ncbi:MAG: hypothetical protein RSC43_06400 [Clostridia bacterium]